jgi:hypothetical protein
MTQAPKFDPKEIQDLFAFLKYPLIIRKDAITAVGTPPSFRILMKAIYWAYLIGKIYYLKVIHLINYNILSIATTIG